VSLTSGREQRNLRQAHALRRYDAGTGLRSLADLEAVLDFFEARRGPLHPFRFRDPFDWKSCPVAQPVTALDQTLGTGDGATLGFAITKTYGTGATAYVRPISLAVAASVRVSVNGITVPAAGFTVSPGGDRVVFAAGHAPAAGAVVKAGYEFDVPVRFDTTSLTMSLSGFKSGQVQSVPLKEVLP
jgi:uncharacterized protein (TIGR02217 family)